MANPIFGPGGNSKIFYEAGNKSTKQAPAWLKSYGLDAYEYECGNGVVGSDANFALIGEEAKKHGISMSLHAPYFISLSSTNPEIRMKSIEYIRKSVHASELLMADTIVIHTGSAGKISREEAMNLARDTLCKTLEEIDTKVILGLETMGKINQLGTLEEVIELCRLSERLSPVVDFGHLNARNRGGYFVTEDDYRRVFDMIGNILGDEKAKHLHCHFSKIEYTSGGEKRHLTFEDKIYGPEFEPLAEAILREDVSPRIICESSETMAQDALAMKNIWKTAAGIS